MRSSCRALLVAVAVNLLVYTASFNFDTCDSKYGAISKVQVSGCDPSTMDYCPLKRNTNVSIDVTFNSTVSISAVEVVVYGYISVIPLPFNIPNPNGCVDSGLTCPLSPNTNYTYQLTIPVKISYPTVRVRIMLQLLNEEKVPFVCLWIPAKIR